MTDAFDPHTAPAPKRRGRFDVDAPVNYTPSLTVGEDIDAYDLPLEDLHLDDEVDLAPDIAPVITLEDIPDPVADDSAGSTAGERTREYVNRRGTAVTVIDSGRKDAGQGKVKKPRGKNLGVVVGSGMRIEQRDLFWLELVCRYKYLSYVELATWANTSDSALRNRVPRLIKAGFFDAWRVHGAQTVVTPTRRAAARYDLDYLLPPTSIEPADLTLLHTSAVARVGMMMWWNDPHCDTHYVLTEREVRAALRNGGTSLLQRDTAHWDGQWPDVDPQQWVIPNSTGFIYQDRADGTKFLTGGYRLPDLCLVRRGGMPVAVEVELSAKQPEAYRELFLTYLSDAGRERYAGVQYYCGSRYVMGEVQRALRKLDGAEEFIHVSEFPQNMPLPVDRIQRVTGMKLPTTGDPA